MQILLYNYMFHCNATQFYGYHCQLYIATQLYHDVLPQVSRLHHQVSIGLNRMTKDALQGCENIVLVSDLVDCTILIFAQK